MDAEAFVNKASGLMEAVREYWVQLRYRVTYAKASSPTHPPTHLPTCLI